MRTNVSLSVVVIFLFCLTFSQSLFAQEASFELNKDYGIKEILTGLEGKRVAIRLDCGEELDGYVTSVGDHLVLISRIAQRDLHDALVRIGLAQRNFYDALVRIEKINAIIVRARNK